MLWVTLQGVECWDERKEEFVSSESRRLQLEHSLVAISKWEARHGKPFLANDKKTFDETIDYIKCMTITQNVKDEAYALLTDEVLKEINDYIDSSMTATRFPNRNNAQSSRDPITSELIYYWMISFNIPFECQKWHLNRLLALIRVCEIKNSPPKKMSRKELLARNAALNRQRKQQLGTKG